MRFSISIFLILISISLDGQDLIFASESDELKRLVQQALDTLENGAENANTFSWARSRLETAFTAFPPPNEAEKEELHELIRMVSDRWVSWSNRQRDIAQAQRDSAKQRAQEALLAKQEAEKQKREALRQKAIAEENGRKAEAGKLLQLSTNLSANNQVSDALLTAYLSIQLDAAAASPAMWQRLGEAYQDSLAARLIPFDRTVQEIIWSPQRKHLISHFSDGSFSIFSFPDPQNPQLLFSSAREVDFLKMSADGTLVIWGSGDLISGYNIKAEKEWSIGKAAGRIIDLAVSPKNKYVAVSTDHRSIEVYPLNNGDSFVLVGHQSKVYQLHFLPDQQHLISRGADRTLRVWNLPQQRQVRSIPAHDFYTTHFATSADGEKILSSGADGFVKFWSRDGELIDAQQTSESAIQQILFSESSDQFATLGSNQEGQFFRLNQGKIEGPENTLPNLAELHSDKRIDQLLGFGQDGKVYLINRKENQDHLFPGHKSPVVGLDFSPPQNLYLSTDELGNILLWNTSAQVFFALDLDQRQDPVPAVFSPDSRGLYYLGSENKELWYTPRPREAYRELKLSLEDNKNQMIKRLAKKYSLSFIPGPDR